MSLKNVRAIDRGWESVEKMKHDSGILNQTNQYSCVKATLRMSESENTPPTHVSLGGETPLNS